MKVFFSKIKEALLSALPITLIVYGISLLPWFSFSKAELITFSISAVLLSFVREDKAETVMNCLEDKFSTIRGGKGITFSLPVSHVAGLAVPATDESKQA